jgi:DNA polymerase
MLWVDFETRSACDLTVAGAYNYAQDASTEVLCMAYAHDDEEVQVWTPDQPFPQKVLTAILSGVQIRAHNAAFERLIWTYVLWSDHNAPVPALEQFYCTAAQARSNCAPGSLEDVGRFAGASMRKDHKGAALVRKCCIPPFKHTPQDLADLFDYCAQDVRAMRAISKALRPLSAEELADYWTNERINDRGVLVDVDLAKAAQTYAVEELDAIQQEVREVTDGEITSVRSPRMREWVWARVGPEARRLMTVHKDGEEKQSIDKTVRAALLILAEENPDEVPPDAATVIQCADDLWASSVAKFVRMANLADVEDHRVRGAFVFAGGAATGRASSYGLQVHNFARKVAKDPQAVRHAMCRGHQIVPAFGKRVTDVLKGMLRPALIPAAGKQFVVADWSAIEGRVNPWLAATPAGDTKLEAFRRGLDAYIVNAAATFGVTYDAILAGYEAEDAVSTGQRQIGKVQELACGFGGGVGAFAAMGRVYNVNLPEHEAKRMVNAWRKANPWAPLFWSDLERAYMGAMRRKGQAVPAGRVSYLFDGAHLWYALPSGRILCYPHARLDADGISYAKASWKPAADAKEWPRARLWPGLACENVTQAAAHDILRHALRELEREGEDVVLHVHDEIVCETSDPARTTELMKRVMTNPPAWAAGLPLGIGIKTMERYGK